MTAPAPGPAPADAAGRDAADPDPTLPLARRLLPPREGLTPWDAAALAVLGLAVAVLARLRRPGAPPFGSDHDEYRMVAEALFAGQGPVVAGVEGTKYPLGYPVLLGLADTAGLSMNTFAFALNLVLLAATVGLVWVAARRLGPLAAFTGGAVVAVSSALWAGVYLAMPDVFLVLLVALGVAVAGVAARPRDVAWLTAICAGAVLLKSVGIVLGLAVGLWLLARPGPQRRWAWAPPVAAGGLVGAQMLATAPYPEHTTGYAATFWLRDPFDAARGTIGPADLPARALDGLDVALRDAGRAVVGAHADPTVAKVALGALVLAAVLVWRRERWLHLAFAGGYVAALAIWPFQSVRLMLPVLPVAALGAAAIAGVVEGGAARAGRPGRVAAVVLVVAALAAFGLWHVQRIAAEAEREGEQYAEIHAAVADAAAWIAANVPADESIASLDYREIAYRLDAEPPRGVLPVSYTSDPDELWAQTGGRAEWFVAIRDLYLAREQRTRDLLRAFPDRFDRAYGNERVEIYRVVPVDDGG